MHQTSSISCTFPCYSSTQQEQTRASFYLRITAVILGILAITVSILALTGVPGLSRMGAGSYVLFTLGVCSVVAGVLIKCVQEHSVSADVSRASQHTVYADPRTRTGADVPPSNFPTEIPFAKSGERQYVIKFMKQGVFWSFEYAYVHSTPVGQTYFYYMPLLLADKTRGAWEDLNQLEQLHFRTSFIPAKSSPKEQDTEFTIFRVFENGTLRLPHSGETIELNRLPDGTNVR